MTGDRFSTRGSLGSLGRRLVAQAPYEARPTGLGPLSQNEGSVARLAFIMRLE